MIERSGRVEAAEGICGRGEHKSELYEPKKDLSFNADASSEPRVGGLLM